MRNRKYPLLESIDTLEHRHYMSGLAVMVSAMAVEDVPGTAPATPPITLPIGGVGGSNGWLPGTIGNPIEGSGGLLGRPQLPSSDPIGPGDYNGPTWAVPLC